MLLLFVQVTPISASAIQDKINLYLTASATQNPLKLAIANGDLSQNNLLFQSLADGLNQAAKYNSAGIWTRSDYDSEGMWTRA